MAILNLTLKNGVTVESVNEALKEASIHGNLIEQIDYSLSQEMGEY